MVVAGAVSAAAIGGFAGNLVGISLITVGLGAVLLLVFYEVGLSEDREREREERRRRKPQPRRRPVRFPRRPHS